MVCWKSDLLLRWICQRSHHWFIRCSYFSHVWLQETITYLISLLLSMIVGYLDFPVINLFYPVQDQLYVSCLINWWEINPTHSPWTKCGSRWIVQLCFQCLVVRNIVTTYWLYILGIGEKSHIKSQVVVWLNSPCSRLNANFGWRHHYV